VTVFGSLALRALAGLLVSVVAATSPPVPNPTVDSRAVDSRVEMSAVQGRAAEQAAARVPEAQRLEEYDRRPECVPGATTAGVCFEGTAEEISIRVCDGAEPILPLWRRARASTSSPWGPWENVVGWTCPGEYEDLPAFTAADFRRLPLAPSPLHVQPARAEHLVNMPAIVYTTPATQRFTTTLLGYPVEVEATAASYTWDFGDGTTLTTTSPGAPYPHHDVAHPYAAPGTWTIALTTTWSGRYRLGGATAWTPVVGTATTTSQATVTTVEARTRLVVADCLTDPSQPDC